MPPPQTIDLHGEELDVVPVPQVADALAEEGREPQDVGTQSVEAASLDLDERSFAHDQTALPVIAPVDHDEDLSVVDPPQELPRIARFARDAHPENIHRRPELDRRECGGRAHRRLPAIGADHEIGRHLPHSRRRPHPHAGDALAVEREAGHFGFHLQLKSGVDAGSLRQKVEEVPLRHERQELAADRKVGEVGERERGVADLSPQLADLLMRQLQEFVEHAELVEDLQSRGVDGVAAKIAKEIGVFLEDFHAYSRSGQQQPEHHARRSAAGDADLTSRLASCSHAQLMNTASRGARPYWSRSSPDPKFRPVHPISEMPMPDLAGWDSFYVIIGSSAAALTGLMFVVIALTGEVLATPAAIGTISAFSTPTVVHFRSGLLLATLLTTPGHTLLTLSGSTGICGIAGLRFTRWVVVQMRRQTEYTPIAEDWMWHVRMPARASFGLR